MHNQHWGSAYYGSQGAGKAATRYKTCGHRGPNAVFDINGATIWAGSEPEVKRALDEVQPEILLCLNGHMGRDSVLSEDLSITGEANIHLPSLSRYHDSRHQPDAVITVEWPDHGAPWMSRQWWESLVSDIERLPYDSNVMIFCMGGHGRTGTALTILGALAGVIHADDDPIDYVRDMHCYSAVESRAQIKYLEDLGIYSVALPSKKYKRKKSSDNDDNKDDDNRNTSDYSDHYSDVEAQERAMAGLAHLFPTVADVDDRKAWPVDGGDNGNGVDVVSEDDIPNDQWEDEDGQCIVCHDEAPYNPDFDAFIHEEHIGSRL